jgi:FlaG/FlaF family flagellin (archaellin)
LLYEDAFVALVKEIMMNLLTIAIVAAIAATVYSLVCGVSSMAADGEVQHHTSEQWMFRRIGFQAAAVLLILLAIWLQ